MTGYSYGARSIWGNPDAVTALKELLESRLTAGEAAKRLTEKFGITVTRNAAIGKAKRLGFALMSDPACRKRPPPKPNPVRDAIYVAHKPRPPVEKPRETVALPVSRRVSLMELTPNSCRWPLGNPGDEDFCFCGADRSRPFDDNRSYCSAHDALAYAPPVGKVNLSKIMWFSR